MLPCHMAFTHHTAFIHFNFLLVLFMGGPHDGPKPCTEALPMHGFANG